MKKLYDHIVPENPSLNIPDEYFQGYQAPFAKSREEIWEELSARLEVPKAPAMARIRPVRALLGVAAAVILLAGLFTIMRFYTRTVSCPPGQHYAYELPDGSSIWLNADSRLTFNPFWWKFERKLSFEGEGYFEVNKGKKFEVVSGIGRTIVVGTSFNIYSREEEYKVNCITGSVKVISFTGAEAVLKPESEARITTSGEISVTTLADNKDPLTWIKNMFNFTSVPLGLVLNEIERQYDVDITLHEGQEYIYTGYFSREKPLEEVLALVCKPFGLKFARISNDRYEIFQE